MNPYGAGSEYNNAFCTVCGGWWGVGVGSRGGTRTPDKVVNSHLLYRLSYPGTTRENLAQDLLDFQAEQIPGT